MTGWEIGGVLATIIGSAVGAVSLLLFGRGQSREHAGLRAAELQAQYDKGLHDGVASVAPDVNLARSELAACRRECDAQSRRAERAERLIEELEAELRRR